MFDEDLPKKKPPGEFPRNLEKMSIDEIENYVSELKAEIARAEGDIKRKKASIDAAASIFKTK